MEYQTWNRNKLIDEIKKERKLKISTQSGGLLGGWDPTLSLTEESLNSLLDLQLHERYVKLKAANDPEFKRAFAEDQEKKRFFNQPECDVDHEYWVKQGYWTIDEIVALLLGKDPRKVTWENVKTHLTKSAFADKFNELRELVLRHVEMKQLSNKTAPGVVLAWAIRLDINVPAKLIEASNKLGIQIADWKSLHDNIAAKHNALEQRYLKLSEEKNNLEDNHGQATLINPAEKADPDDLGEKERSSLFMIVATMAYIGYKYDSQQKKSLTPAELSKDVTEALGENIDVDTVRKWLKRATDRYPRIAKTE